MVAWLAAVTITIGLYEGQAVAALWWVMPDKVSDCRPFLPLKPVIAGDHEVAFVDQW